MDEWARWAVPKASSGEYNDLVSFITNCGDLRRVWGSKHTDVHIAKSGKAFPEFLHFGLVGFSLIALLILGRTLLLNVESQVLEEYYSAPFGLFDNLLNLGTNTVWCKSDRLPEKLLKLGNDRFQAVLVVQLAIGPTQVGH